MKYKSSQYTQVDRGAQKRALDALVDNFSDYMKAKLHRQVDKGREGWDDTEWTEDQILSQLKDHVEKGDMVDVANIAAFKWNREKRYPITGKE